MSDPTATAHPPAASSSNKPGMWSVIAAFMVIIFSTVLVLAFEQLDFGLGIVQKRTGQLLILVGALWAFRAAMQYKNGD